MAEKKHGLSPDLLIHPGETISDLLEERHITQKELARRTGVSEAFLSDVIHGKKDISKGLAMKLEYAFGIRRSFWLNLQADYDAEVLSIQEEYSIEEEEKKVLSAIQDIVRYLEKNELVPAGKTWEQTILALRRFFRVSSLCLLRDLVPAGVFRMSDQAKTDPDVLGAWLCLCKRMDSEEKTDFVFEQDRTDELILELKKIMMTEQDIQMQLKELFRRYGVIFHIVHHFRGAPVQGYLTRRTEQTYQMVLTIRGAFADIFWFSLFHELGHIVNGDVSKSRDFIDVEGKQNAQTEKAADQFACDALLSRFSYQKFVNEGDYSPAAICRYAKTQNVPPYIVIGRLQKEERIPWSQYQKEKPKYKWAEEMLTKC